MAVSFVLQGVLVAALLSIGTSLIASGIWARKYERRFTTISVPVFIRGQDAQGGQFALGVVRAMEHAALHGNADVDGRRVEPVFIDEDLAFKGDESVAALVERIRKLNPPVVVGPLTSSAAKLVVPKIAGDLGIPMILGIPTAMTATAGSNGYAWRLSPKNDEQAKAVSAHYSAVRKDNDRLFIIQDESDNPAYSNDLVGQLMPVLDKPGRPSPEKIVIKTRGDYVDVDTLFSKVGDRPLSIIYVGMPEVARALIAKAAEAKIDALWIFTDGCITDRGLIAAASKLPNSQFYVTFQGPPAIDSPGLLRYIWYVRNTGGHVSFAVENSKCAADLSASSYEIFGFDSYLMALKVMKEASESGQLTPKAVNRVLGQNHLSDPFLLLGPYIFAKNDSTNLTFHMYQIAGNCVSKWPPKGSESPNG